MPILSAIGAACARAFGMFGGNTVSASYLVVAGGGSGANGIGGGGGAGGLLTGTISLDATSSYTIVVGAGAAGSPLSGSYINGNNGSNSSAFLLTAIGGGYGGTYNNVGASGGSGGGGGTDNKAGGSGTSGQGNAGGTSNNAYPQQSGGGGGAGAAGANATNSNAGNGGVGIASSISGTSTYYAGGGGGSFNADSSGAVGSGGSGGGTAGGNQVASDSAAANTGGGSGGGGYRSIGGGTPCKGSGNGGSGIVIVSYAGTQKFGGGVVTSVGGNTIHTFTTSGSLTPISPITASYLVVAGGAGGGSGTGGGGGAGGLLSGSGLTIDPYSTYLVTVGAGGTAGVATGGSGGAGGNSSFLSITSTGGGYGGTGYGGGVDGGSGGSGGGGGPNNHVGGSGTSGQGYGGGTGSVGSGGAGSGVGYNAGGGGGAGAVGSNATTSVPGNGGVGVASSISGTSTYYAGGGGGGRDYYRGITTGGTGGTGGGGSATNTVGGSGTANTGGGGAGGANSPDQNGGAGGSGIVIISYPGSTQLMAGGTVTISGGNVIHTFTSSGYLAPIKYLTNSLRFRSSASAYLNRTFGTPTSGTTWTYSAWIKFGIVGTGTLFEAGTGASNTFNRCTFGQSSQELNWRQVTPVGGLAAEKGTSMLFRDPSAWYHIVCVWDTTNATAGDRQRVYVNGSRVTSFSSSTDPSLNLVSYFNTSGYVHNIGALNLSGYGGYFDGYMTETNFIDGQALTPNSFGTFNSYGVWQPIAYAGSYGTNGFYLPFTNTSSTTTLGYDFSGNSNNWTTNNISLTAGSTYDAMTDVPTLTSATASNYCVLNPLNTGSNITLSGGNLNLSQNGSAGISKGTIAVSSGKWYWECTLLSGTGESYGIAKDTALPTTTYVGYSADTWGYQSVNGKSYNNIAGGSTATTYGATWTTNDIIGVALDLDSGTLTFYKNGTSQGIAFTGLSGTFTPAIGNDAVHTDCANFGQRPFTYTPPSGYVALNTYNM